MSADSQPHSDIRPGDWVDRFLPVVARPYARLMRLDRPIGTWLLLLPCWWGVVLAAQGDEALFLLFVFAWGAIFMRGAGCVINDLWDRNFDRKIARTQSRPIASGQVALQNALFFLLFLLWCGLAALLCLNSFTQRLTLVSLPLVVLYPLAKRFLPWPQLVLGIVFNWGALAGWSAVRGDLEAPAFLLYLGGVFWTLAYDTIYAHQDKKDDALLGLRSMALWLGDRSKKAVAFFYAVALVFIGIAGFVAGEGILFYILLCGAAGQAVVQMRDWKKDEPEDCLKKFQKNRDFGLLIFAALAAGKFL